MDDTNNGNADAQQGDPEQFDLRDCIEYHVIEATRTLRSQLEQANAKITPSGFELVELDELARLRRAADDYRRVCDVVGCFRLPER